MVTFLIILVFINFIITSFLHIWIRNILRNKDYKIYYYLPIIDISNFNEVIEKEENERKKKKYKKIFISFIISFITLLCLVGIIIYLISDI